MNELPTVVCDKWYGEPFGCVVAVRLELYPQLLGAGSEGDRLIFALACLERGKAVWGLCYNNKQSELVSVKHI